MKMFLSVSRFFLWVCIAAFILFVICGKIAPSIQPVIIKTIPTIICSPIAYALGLIIGRKWYGKKEKLSLMGYDKYYLRMCLDVFNNPVCFELYEAETEKWVGCFSDSKDAIAFAVKKENGEMALPASYPASSEMPSP
jgi:hypothetical protein